MKGNVLQPRLEVLVVVGIDYSQRHNSSLAQRMRRKAHWYLSAVDWKELVGVIGIAAALFALACAVGVMGTVGGKASGRDSISASSDAGSIVCADGLR